MPSRAFRRLRLHRRPGPAAAGLILAGHRQIPVALGQSSLATIKREGDGATPRGVLALVRLWWRADRGPRPRSLLPVRRIGPTDAWCDPKHPRYNALVRLTPDHNGDRLWRADDLYNLLIELDYNTRPRIAGRGSALFIHMARPGLCATAGCLGMPEAARRRLLPRLGPKTRVIIE
jgi:L,D-peptidoglycan transpeptidase YkuD (ErfK/YbiS/YcfS/YnhG family)